MTKQKQAVLRVVHSAKCHYTAEEIFEKAKEILPEISRATVYNNLHALEREKLIRRITAEDASDRYDSSFIPHGHLYCSACNEISDFNVPDFIDTLTGIIGGEIDSYELKVRYICKACMEKRKAEKEPALN